jgi:hypothetical protein
MTQNVDERLASVVRALTEVVLPHLPADASLAQEQVQLCVGHLQILRAQFDAVPAYEREELADAIALARELESATDGNAALGAVISAADGSDVRGQRIAINKAIEEVIQSGGSNAAVSAIILKHERVRANKDRRWLLPFGFDTLEPAT